MIRNALFSLLALSLAAQTPAPTDAQKQGAPKTEAVKPAAQATPAEAAKPAAKEAPKPVDPNTIVAVIGKEVIRQHELDEVLKLLPDRQQMSIRTSAKAQEQFKENYITSRLMAQKAKKEGLDKTPDFQLKLSDSIRELLAKQLMERDGKELQKKLDDIKEEDLKAAYDKSPNKYKSPEKATARHILVSTKAPKGKEKGLSEEEAKAKIAKIQEELKSGKKLEDLAKEYSDDPGSKDKGGLYKDFNPETMVPEFANAVRTQELGKVGEPVKTSFGYHIILVEARTPSSTKYEDVKDQIRQGLLPERRQAIYKEYVDGLKKEIPVVTGEAAATTAKMMGLDTAKPAAKTAKPATKSAAKETSK